MSSLYSKMKFDIDLYLPDLLLMFLDQVTMANTIEGRVPYLDKELVIHSLGLNSYYHLENNNNRKVQKEISKNKLMPATYVQKKQGFSGPVIEWIKKNYEIFFSVIIESDVSVMEKKYINNLYEKRKLENKDYYNIFSLYCFTIWHNNL